MTQVPALARRRRRSLRVVVPTAAVSAVVVTTFLAGADPRVAGVVALVATLRLLSVRRAVPTESAARGAWSVATSLVLPTAIVVLALAVTQQPVALRNEVALLGSCAAVVAALAFLLVSLRRAKPRVVVVGDENGVADLLQRWGSGEHLQVVGALVRATGPRSPSRGPAADLGVPVVASAAALPALIRSTGADVVLVEGRTAAIAGEVRRLEWQLGASSVAVLCAGATGHVAPRRLGWTTLDGTTFSVITSPSAQGARVLKAVVDRVLAGVLVLCVLPLIAVLALVVRLDSKGPAFFRQTRVGLDGRTFTLHKLRTMTVDAEETKAALIELSEGDGVLFKMRNDPRITRVGRWLRALSLDELPQLWNVVKGDMSLVGPRPALPEEVALYNELERRRLVVKPGVTGVWQVSGRSSLSRERSMQLDAGYADNWHPAGDARILLRTVDAVLLRRGAF